MSVDGLVADVVTVTVSASVTVNQKRSSTKSSGVPSSNWTQTLSPLDEVAGHRKDVPLDHPMMETARLSGTCMGD